MSDNPTVDRRMTDEEMAAYNGLLVGDLNGLADLLAEGTDTLHHMIQKRLLIMIDQWQGSDYALKVEKLKQHNQVMGYKRDHARFKNKLADRMIELGAEKRGHLERAARAALAEEPFKSRNIDIGTAIKHYRDVRDGRKFLRGLLQK